MAASIIGTVSAQGDKGRYIATDRAQHADNKSVVTSGAGWVRSHFFDEWFFQVQGGGQLYYGTDDREGAFGDRLTGNMEFHFGRRIFPMFGFRANLGYGYAHGFLTKDHYNSSIISGGDGQCGTDAFGNPLGGYYWDYNNDLLQQKWSYYYIGIDVFLNMAIFRGAAHYEEFRPWEHILYSGVDNKYAVSEVDGDKNHRTEFHVGYVLKHNFPSHFSIYTDIRYSWIERTFDREWVAAIETPGFALDGVFNLQVGVMYKFHMRTDEERSVFRETDRINAIDTLAMYGIYRHTADTIFSEMRYDTLNQHSFVNIDPPEWAAQKDSLLALIAERNARRNGSNNEDDLFEILMKQLLPYEMVFFELDKWNLLAEEETKIAKMAQIMKSYPDKQFILTGSADSKTGTPGRNIFLSHKRADIVYDRLVNHYGIDPTQLRREYLGGILQYAPFELNRTTVIIMDHPVVRRAFEEMRSRGDAGGGQVEINVNE